MAAAAVSTFASITYDTVKVDNTYLATSPGDFKLRSRTMADIGTWTVLITSELDDVPP